MRPSVKICGITRAEDALEAIAAGADFLGFVFVKSSPRFVEPDVVRGVVQCARGQKERISCVGVFVDEDVAWMNEVADIVGLDLVQLHGKEDASILGEIERPVIRALRVRETLPDAGGWAGASWMLYDRFSPASEGGTGQTFDWSILADAAPTQRFFLSGGLRPDNVAAAIEIVRPAAIDVSSGVEDAPGIKSVEKLRALFDAIREATVIGAGQRGSE